MLLLITILIIALHHYIHKPKQYYVHALLTLNGVLQYHSPPYRTYTMAFIDAYVTVTNHPYGQAVITNTSDHPPITH